MAKAEEVMKRRRAVARLLASTDGVGFHNVTQIAEEWECSEATIWADRRKVINRMGELLEDQGPLTVTEFMAQLDGTIARAGEDPRTLGVAASLLALKAKIGGLEKPVEVEVTHKLGSPLVDAGDDEMEWVLAVLARSRDGLLTGPERDALALLKAGAMRQLAGPDEIEAEWAEVE
jgi:hypothetical protein